MKMKMHMLSAAVAASLLLPAVAFGATGKGKDAFMHVGEVKIAPAEVSDPQISLLAAKAKFPLLPMLLSQIRSADLLTKKFGPTPSGKGSALAFFVDKKGSFKSTLFSPVMPNAADDWAKANKPAGKIGTSNFWNVKIDLPAEAANMMQATDSNLFATFTPDKLWVIVSDDKQVLNAAVKYPNPAEKPLSKGLLSVRVEGAKAFDAIAAAIRKSVESDKDKPVPGGADLAKMAKNASVLASALEMFRCVAGVSENSLDLRMKTAFRGKAENGIDALVKLLGKGAFEVEKTIAGKDFRAVFPDAAKIGKPLFASKFSVKPFQFSPELPAGEKLPEGFKMPEIPSIDMWTFGWQSKNELRSILRIPTDEIAKIFSSLMQMAPGM